MKNMIRGFFLVCIVFGKAYSDSFTGLVTNVFYSVGKQAPSHNFIQFNVKDVSGAIKPFAIPLAGGTYRLMSNNNLVAQTPFTDQEASRLLSLLLTAKTTGKPLAITWTVKWFRPDENTFAFNVIESAELVP